jgi:signal transduction histidine kinase
MAASLAFEPPGSGARVVAAADCERRRLERDLHDGAQQRLVSLSLQLRLLSTRFEPESEEQRLLSAVRSELSEALNELRDLAHGCTPRSSRAAASRPPSTRSSGALRSPSTSTSIWTSGCRKPSRSPPTTSSPRR